MSVYVVYEEPTADGKNITTTIPVGVAVEMAKKGALKAGHVYDSDEDALMDFITIHWAWLVEK